MYSCYRTTFAIFELHKWQIAQIHVLCITCTYMYLYIHCYAPLSLPHYYKIFPFSVPASVLLSLSILPSLPTYLPPPFISPSLSTPLCLPPSLPSYLPSLLPFLLPFLLPSFPTYVIQYIYPSLSRPLSIPPSFLFSFPIYVYACPSLPPSLPTPPLSPVSLLSTPAQEN